MGQARRKFPSGEKRAQKQSLSGYSTSKVSFPMASLEKLTAPFDQQGPKDPTGGHVPKGTQLVSDKAWI